MTNTKPKTKLYDTVGASAYLDKGGVGKSTSIAHIAAALAELGLDVVVVDLASKQGDLAKIFGVADEVSADVEAGDDWPNVATTFDEQWPQMANRITEKVGDDVVDLLVYETDEGVDLIPTHETLDGLDTELRQIEKLSDRYSRFQPFVDEFLVPRYDAILVDLPGAPNAITYNGIWATRNVIAPAKLGALESDQLDQLETDLKKIKKNDGPEVSVAMVLPTMVNEQTKLAREFGKSYAEDYSDVIAPAHITETQDIPNATKEGKTLFAYECDLDTAERAKEAYRINARELVERIGGGLA